ncbi:MAG: hypothetical protein H6825_04405 [Planctomycetes bacterium]|nr:hypothetical protein [Planctomycetota bacterium]
MLAICLLASAALFRAPLFEGRSTLAFDPAHALYPAPWARPVDEPPPINPITSDIDFFVLPGLMRLRQLAAEGASPWWDADQLCGYPLGANLPFPFLQPLTWLTSGLDPVTTLDVLLWLHTALAAALACSALRRFGAGLTASALGAVLFALSTWMVTRWHLPQIGYTTAWWPGLVGALVPLRDGRHARALGELALFTALAFVSGFPQAGVAFVGGLGLLALAERRLRRPRPLGVLVVGLVLGLLLAWPQFAALRSVYGQSLRSSPQTQQATAGLGLRPGALLGALLPELFGRPSDFADVDPPAPTLSEYLPVRELLGSDVRENPVENALYPGAAALLLLGLLLAPRTRAAPVARHLAALAALSMLASLLFPWMAKALPALSVLAAAHVKRLLVLVAGSVPLAAALVFDGLARGPGDVAAPGSRAQDVAHTGRRLVGVAALLVLAYLGVLGWSSTLDAPDAAGFAERLVPQVTRQVALLGLATLLLALVVAGRRAARVAGVLLVALTVFDLAGLAYTFNPFPPQHEVPFAETPTLRWLSEREGRVCVLGDELVLPPTLAATFGLRSVHGVAPLLGRRIAELLGCVEGPLVDPRDPRVVRPFHADASVDHPLLDLLDVHTVVHRDPGLAARLGRANAWEDELDGLGALDRPGAGPRAFVAHGARLVPDAHERLDWLARTDAPVHRTVLVERPLPFELPDEGDPGAVEVRRDRSGDVALEASSDGPGVLVLSECWDAGWTARVDGVATRPIVVDHALLGVPLAAGAHEVELRYALPGWDGACLVSAGAAVVTLLLVLRLMRRERALASGGPHAA